MINYNEARYLTTLASQPKDEFEVDDILDYVGSTILDIGVSAVNSLSSLATLGYGGTELDTGEILHSINEDAGRFYDQNKELVQLSSFVGGLVLPGMAAAKAMRWAKGGRLWVGDKYATVRHSPIGKWEEGIRTSQAQAIKQIRKGAEASAEYNKAISTMRWDTLKQGVAEGVVYEASFAALMNQHAYLDNDYDIGDIALGVGLGALAGPIRLIQQSKALRAASATAKGKYLEGFQSPMRAQGETAGDTLAYAGYTYRNISNNPQLSKGDNLAKQAKLQAVADQRFQIAKMSDNKLNARNKIIRPKIDPIQTDIQSSGDTLFDTPEVILELMNSKNPEVFKGVHKFSELNVDEPLGALIQGTVDKLDDGFKVSTGAVAKDVLFSGQAGRTAKSTDYLATRIPTNVTVTTGLDRVVEISVANMMTKEAQEWIADYLAIPFISQQPVKIIGATKKLKPNYKALRNKAIEDQLFDLGNTFRTTDEILDVLPAAHQSTRGIIDPFFGERILSEVDAIATAGANTTTRAKFNTKATIFDDIKYRPFEDASDLVDGAFIQAQYAAKNTSISGRVDLSLGDDMIPKLQAFIQRYEGLNFPQLRLGDEIVSTATRAKELLWEAKQKLVYEGLDKGASLPQIAKHTNLPLETVETLAVAEKRMLSLDDKLPITRYNKLDPEHYLVQKPIVVQGDTIHYGQVEELRTTSILDASDMVDAHRQIVFETIHSIPEAGAELRQSLEKVFQSKPMKYIEDNIQKAFSRLENRWHTFSSADHALRELGYLGDSITTVGKDFVHYTNEHIKRLKDSISPHTVAIAQNPAARTQFSMLRQALHAIPSGEAKSLAYDAATKRIIKSIDAETQEIAYLTYHGTDDVIEFTPQMDSFMQSWVPVQRELLAIDNVNRKLHNLPKLEGAGIWLPYPELNKEFVAYKMAKQGHNVEILTASNAKEFKELVAEARQTYGASHEIVEHANTELWNQLNRYGDLENFRIADISMKKAGITDPTIRPGLTDIAGLVPAVQNAMWGKYRKIFKASNSKVFDALDFLATQDIATAGGKGQTYRQMMQRKTKTAEHISHVLLNKSLVHTSKILDDTNNITTAIINSMLDKTEKLLAPIKNRWEVLTKEGKFHIEDEYQHVVKALEESGVPLPKSWETLQQYELAAAKSQGRDIAKHRVQQAQSMMVFLNLRAAEFAHAAVTTLSFPVIMSGEIAHNKGRPLKTMMEAVKFWNGKTDEVTKIRKYAAERGYTSGVIAETVAMMEDLYTEKGFLKQHEGLIRKLTWASDTAENMVREYAFATGYTMAKQKHPTASMEILATAANAFTVRTMGNYSARQRPTLFQGTFGAMIGLYQTFMLTMGQNMFRYIEAKDYKAMTTLMASQASMFGLESLPMYQTFNKVLGGWVNDDHNDIRSTIYGAFGDADQDGSLAEYVLFGLPSAATGMGLYTRATLDPRAPIGYDPTAGLSFKPPVMDAIAQTIKFSGNIASGVARGLGPGGSISDVGTAIFQGIAAQHLWRPAARYSERFALGYSFDQKGEVISTEEEVKDGWATFSRVFGARPLKEQALRNMRFSASYYNTIDEARKAKVRKQLRRIVTEGHKPEQVEALFVEYIENGGKYSGWKQLVNGAYMSMEQPYAHRLVEDVKNQEAILDVVNTYGGG